MDIKNFKFNIKHDDSCECGSLIALESYKNIPFDIKRVFFIYGVDTHVSRGAHAHRTSNQLLVCVSGSCEIILDDSKERHSVLLEKPNHGLYQEAMIWGEMHKFSKDCILMVLSDSYYDEKEYIRNYNEFLTLCEETT